MVAERELRARADGAVHAWRRARLHRARRARAGARPHRLRNDWLDGAGTVNFRFDPSATTPGRSGVRPDRALQLAGRAPALPQHITPRSSSRSCGATSSPAAGRGHRGAARGSTRGDSQIRPWSRRSSATRLYTGPRMVKPPVVYNAGLLRASAAASTRRPGRGSRTWPGSASSARRTSPAGTTSAGSTPPPSAAAGPRQLRPPSLRATDKKSASLPRTPRARRRRARVCGSPTLRPRPAARSRFATHRPG